MNVIISLVLSGSLKTFGALASDKIIANVIVMSAEMLAKRTTNKIDDVLVENWKKELNKQGLL